MRRNAITTAVKEEDSEINLTPMLDVVFIMLIFFIVTANFIKEPGLEINRPDSDTAETQENAAILIAVGATGEVWISLLCPLLRADLSGFSTGRCFRCLGLLGGLLQFRDLVLVHVANYIHQGVYCHLLKYVLFEHPPRNLYS